MGSDGFSVAYKRWRVLNEEKLKYYSQISDDICLLTEEIVDKLSKSYQLQRQEINLKDRINFALGKKIYFAFKSLIDDTSRKRTEAIHHLKTLIESFIYLYWINQENDSDKRAKFVLAMTYKKKMKFFNANPNYPDNEANIKEWKNSLEDITKDDLKKEWDVFKEKSFYEIAEECGLKEQYNRIYRLACEPAHITDLLEYMPLPKGPFTLAEVKTAGLWAFVAIDYGIFTMCNLLQSTSDFYNLGFERQIDELKKRINTIREL